MHTPDGCKGGERDHQRHTGNNPHGHNRRTLPVPRARRKVAPARANRLQSSLHARQKDDSRLRRRSGDAGHDYRHPQARLHVLSVASGEAALGLLKHEDVDLILLDVRLPGISGFDVLRIVKENYTLVECIMISAINEVETAVQAMKNGAYHYITKDFDYDELRSLVRNACERQDLNRQVITLSAQVAEQSEREFLDRPEPEDPRHRRSRAARSRSCRRRC